MNFEELIIFYEYCIFIVIDSYIKIVSKFSDIFHDFTEKNNSILVHPRKNMFLSI